MISVKGLPHFYGETAPAFLHGDEFFRQAGTDGFDLSGESVPDFCSKKAPPMVKAQAQPIHSPDKFADQLLSREVYL